MRILVFIICICTILSCNDSRNPIVNAIEIQSKLGYKINKSNIQIKLTIIDSIDQFNEFEYNVDSKNYFYPASTVKLPIALFALEKLNEYPELSINTPFMLEDDTLKTTIKNEIEKIFLLSDNQANNRLFEFIGQDYINKKFISKGFKNSKIFHRLSTSNSSKLESKRVDFYLEDSIFSFQNNNQNLKKLNLKNLKKGIGYINSEGNLINDEMDFSRKNFISIENLHRILKILFFPEKFNEKYRFNLTQEQQNFVFKCMSGIPEEFGYNREEFPYYFGKFFIYGDKKLKYSEKIKIYNKVGLAYGQLTDTAYIIKGNKSIILTATINVNSNEVYNDDKYEYDSVGFPFLAKISREILNNLYD